MSKQSAVISGYRLSSQQRRLWALQRGSAAYAAQCALLLPKHTDAARLRRALTTVLMRHEILRTTFPLAEGLRAPVQVVGEEPRLAWGEEETSAAPAGEAEWQELFAREREALGTGSADDGGNVRALLLREGNTDGSAWLVLSVPAMCADEWALGNVAREAAESYARAGGAESGGGGSEAGGAADEDDVLQYASYAEWQRELQDEEEAAAGRQFWEKQRALAPQSRPSLGIERQAEELTASERAGFAPEVYTRRVGADVSARVAEAARGFGVRTETLLLGCWMTLLRRFMPEEGVVVNCLAGGREHEVLRDGVGLVARFLPVRLRLEGAQRLAQVLPALEEAVTEAREWQEYFTPERDGWAAPSADSPAPLSDGANEKSFLPLAFEYAPPLPSDIDDERAFSMVGLYCCHEPFELKLRCVERADGLGVELHYDPAKYRARDARRLAEHFTTLLASAARDAGVPLGRLEIFGEAERRELLEGLNQTELEVARDLSLAQLFERRAAERPEQVALVCGEESLTFAELNGRANRVAHRLARLGVGREVPVGICFERSVWMVVGLLGILKAGGAYVPLDSHYPRERLELLLADTMPPVLLTQQSLRDYVPEAPGRATLCLDAEWPSLEGESAENPAPQAGPENLAYVIYTSGSTGRPKGVMVEHGSVVNLLAALREVVYANFGEGRALRVGVNAPFVFDASVKQLAQLFAGHTLDIVPEEVRADAEALLRYLDEHRLDVFDCTPSQLKLLLAAAPPGLGARSVLVGGEAIDAALWGALARQAETSYFNLYGPTECTVDTCVARVRAGTRPVIGRPVANARVYLLDGSLAPVPFGAPGELYVGGAQLARGYLNRPGLTAERFVPDPFSQEPGARLYRTGDLARFVGEGEVAYLGRADFQVKLRGYRIELGEVEAALTACEGVREAVVVARAEEGEEPRLVAYLVGAGPAAGAGVGGAQPANVAAVRESLRRQLPEYMVPSAFVLLERLPLNSNGKVDRKALPKPSAERPETGAGFVAPRGRVEQSIANIWQELLRVERVGVDDNFFDLGGHSLLMVQAHSRLRETFGKEIAMVELFRHPTVRALARFLGDEGGQQPSFAKSQQRAGRRREALRRQTQTTKERKKAND